MKWMVIAAIVTLPSMAVGETPYVAKSRTPAEVAVIEALRLAAGSDRENEVQRRLREALASPDRTVVSRVLQLVFETRSEVDWRAWSDVLREKAATGSADGERVLVVMDEIEFAQASRDQQERLLAEALRSGSVRLRNGTSWPASRACQEVAVRGFRSLWPLLEEREGQQNAMGGRSIARLRNMVEIAATVAEGRRIEEIRGPDGTDVAQRMETDEEFREAVIDLATVWCAVDVVSGRPGERCRQLRATSRQKHREGLGGAGRAEWRDRLERLLGSAE